MKKKTKRIKINLGCGTHYLDGYINCDYLSNVRVDKILDLNAFPYPFTNTYADEIYLDNVLEHLDDIVKVLEELHRILKKGGILTIIVPYAKSEGALQDPTHKHLFTERSMDYFSGTYSYNFYSKARFTIKTAKLCATENTLGGKIRKYIPARQFLKRFLFNMYDYVYFELIAS